MEESQMAQQYQGKKRKEELTGLYGIKNTREEGEGRVVESEQKN